jgi:hypothetical protein
VLSLIASLELKFSSSLDSVNVKQVTGSPTLRHDSPDSRMGPAFVIILLLTILVRPALVNRPYVRVALVPDQDVTGQRGEEEDSDNKGKGGKKVSKISRNFSSVVGLVACPELLSRHALALPGPGPGPRAGLLLMNMMLEATDERQ